MSNDGQRHIGKRIADRYCITGEIGKGGMGVVYRAIPFDDPSHTVAIKVIQRSGQLGYDDLMRFQKEASLMSQLHHPHIVVFHELGLFGSELGGARTNTASDLSAEEDPGSGYFIVMEVADGNNLKDSLAKDGRKDLAFFFQVGLQVSSALDYTHGKNIIHRDIKPHNIIVGKPFTDRPGVLVKVLDFGVARLAEAMHSAGRESGGKAFEEAAGTPLYMAPEQTPLMDAPVDHRVDLYSLGCVLYEVLTGKPPFTASSREKLEKQHVFAEVEPLTHLRPDVPPIVEKIVHKLLAKHPKDRYQTAFALHADLLRAKSLFEQSSRTNLVSFPLGLKDRFQAVSAQLEIVGREKELKTLIDEYEGVAATRGRSRISLVRGAAGVGKTRLMAEFQSYLAKRKVRFISGSFSQHENALPFNALANAFNEYLYRVLKSHPYEAEELRRRIKTTIGPAAHRVASIVPGLKAYLVDIPEDETSEGEVPAETSAPIDDFARFTKAFSDFTRCLGTDGQPVVFLFHDLHWADDKSLDLIDTFFSNANTLPFYLVASERSGAHLQSERFQQFIEKFKKLKRRYTEIELSPVDRPAIRGIVANMLSSPSSVEDSLVDYLEEQSKGNPMHLVELTRTLVARDFIAPKPIGHEWDYDILTLRKTQVQLNTIDLVVSRLQDYQEFDRYILGVAATVGLTFQFEVLLLNGRTQSVQVMRAIQRAMDEGLVTRVTDESDLRHLGKTFMFAHKKARDAVYEALDDATRRDLHRQIGEKLEAAIPKPSAKLLFALAHHFNSAWSGSNKLATGQNALADGANRELALRVLKYNKKAGFAAYQSGSWQTAERYFENAWRIMQIWQDQICTSVERARVRETLADLAAVQRRHGQALKTYRELLELSLPLDVHAEVAHKAVYFQLVGGQVSDTAKLIHKTLTMLRVRLPRVNSWTHLFMKLSIAFDAWLQLLPKDKNRIFQVMRFAYADRDKDQAEMDRKHPVIRLAALASLLFQREQRHLALAYHQLAFREALARRASPASAITAVAERAALLGYHGFTAAAYQIFDLTMDAARACHLRNVYGYVALLRALTIDYIKDRHEDISEHLRVAMEYLRPNEDRLAFGQALTYRMFRDLLRGNLVSLYTHGQHMPETIPTRNWLSPRSVAFILFGLFLQGSRDNIVRRGETFLKRRQKVSGRSHDIFVRIIHTLIAFARGEIDKTREFYSYTVREFIDQRESYWVYEEDFIGVFALTFPILFEQEYGRHLMRDEEMQVLLEHLRRRIQKIKGRDRAIPAMLLARCNELLGHTKNIRVLYHRALRNSQVASNHLVQILTYLWFGTHLIDHGQTQKRDFVRRALLLAHKFELKALVEYTRKLMEKRDIQIKELQLITGLGSRDANAKQTAPQASPLFVEHLHHLCEAAESEVPFLESIEQSFKILAKSFPSGRVHLLVHDQQHGGARGASQVLWSSDPEAATQAIVEYVEPYLNIRSTLFLPLSDAPWVQARLAAQQGRSSATAAGRTRETPSGALTPETVNEVAEAESFDGSSTLFIGVDHASTDSLSTEFLSTAAPDAGASLGAQPSASTVSASLSDVDNTVVDSFGSLQELSATARSRMLNTPARQENAVLPMSALIPLRVLGGSLGVIFVEDIGPQPNRDSTRARQELDQFGAQIGILLQQKAGYAALAEAVTKSEAGSEVQSAQSATNAIYQAASYTLEPCNWLNIWHYGRLRAQRETSWYLGLNIGPNQYLMAYCMLTGNELARDRLAAMIWQHFYVIRALAVASGRQHLEINEIREEFASFFAAVPRASALENMSLAFTLVQRQERLSFSGHFGPSRPFAIGVENLVSPHNEVYLTYANGRDLRYWEVSAELAGPHTLILSYDTSKLDSAPMDTVQKRVAINIAKSENADELHRILGSMVAEENLPRYYVAAVLRDEAELKHAEAKKTEALKAEALHLSLPPLAKAE